MGTRLLRTSVERLLRLGSRSRAGAVQSVYPWDEITTGPALTSLLARAGVVDAAVEATTGERHELERPEDFWEIALGSGYRATVDALNDEQLQRLRERVLGELRSRGITKLQNDVVFGIAVRS